MVVRLDLSISEATCISVAIQEIIKMKSSFEDGDVMEKELKPIMDYVDNEIKKALKRRNELLN